MTETVDQEKIDKPLKQTECPYLAWERSQKGKICQKRAREKWLNLGDEPLSATQEAGRESFNW